MENQTPQGQVNQAQHQTQAAPQAKSAPIAVHRDGAVSTKVWPHVSKQGNVFYTTTLQKTFTDPATGKPRETRSLNEKDLLKVPRLTEQAYDSIKRFKAQDRENAKAQEQGHSQAQYQAPLEQTPVQDMSQHREWSTAQVHPRQEQAHQPVQQPSRTPDHSR